MQQQPRRRGRQNASAPSWQAGSEAIFDSFQVSQPGSQHNKARTNAERPISRGKRPLRVLPWYHQESPQDPPARLLTS